MSLPWDPKDRPRQHDVARELRAILQRSQLEAAERGSATIEAEHLLLAVTAFPESLGATFLAECGLDHAALDAALIAERRHSLESVGAPQFSASDLTAAPRKLRPRWGASSRETFNRGFRMARGGRDHASTLNIVVGALSAELGTVPRMLSIAGVDRHQILGRATVQATKGLSR